MIPKIFTLTKPAFPLVILVLQLCNAIRHIRSLTKQAFGTIGMYARPKGSD